MGVLRRVKAAAADLQPTIPKSDRLLGIAESPAPDWVPLAPGQTLALNGFAALYTRHMQDEDHLVYPAAHAALTGDALQTMSQDMMQRRGVRAAQ